NAYHRKIVDTDSRSLDTLTVHQLLRISRVQRHPITARLHGMDHMSTVHKVSSEFGSPAHLSQRVYLETKKAPDPRPSVFFPGILDNGTGCGTFARQSVIFCS
ncbi:GL26983, partial [Drosophila persimilis]